jgi:uncharacterized damage-inducible protein DinB
MEAKELILRSLEQSQGYVTKTLDGLTQEKVAWSPTAECDSIAFTLWHTVRVEDTFVHRVVQHGKELYETEGWQEKLGTPIKASRYSAKELQAWKAPQLDDLRNYANAIREKTLTFLQSATPEKLSEEVVRPNRPTDSVIGILGRISRETALHARQITYLRGVQWGLDK